MNYVVKIIVSAFFLTVSLFALIACQQKEPANQIRVGTISGPETQLMEVAKQVALKKYNLHIVIVPFSDYTMPNRALANGSIDANMFQTIPYLNADVKAHGYKLAIIGKTFIYPMAIYSKKIKHIGDTPENAIVAIPNDPSNEARALLLLQKAKLITLKPNAGVFATTLDITSNPKHIQIKELGAAELPRSLADVTMAAINTNYAIPAHLYPTKNGIFSEGKDSLYANVIVVRAKDKHKIKFKELVEALHSKAVMKAAKRLFKGQAISAWNPDPVKRYLKI